jgi:rubredoxin
VNNTHYNKGGIIMKYVCIACQWEYDPAVGDPDGGIAPGTAFEDIPEDWVCPVCGVGKDMFEAVE